MFGKPIILIILLALLLVFYLVIRAGAGKKKDIDESKNLIRYHIFCPVNVSGLLISV